MGDFIEIAKQLKISEAQESLSNDTSMQLHYWLGEASESVNKFDDALRYYEETLSFVDASEELAVVFNAMGLVCKKKGDYMEAMKYYQKALKAFPGAVFAKENLEIVMEIAFGGVSPAKNQT